MSFMQPSDYIIILENNLIKVIHHGGIVMEQHTPVLNKEISESVGKIIGLLLAK